jgi:hypothetical protein
MDPYPWMVEVERYGFDWDSSRTEWLHRVSECARELGELTVNGRKYDDTTRPFWEVTAVQDDGSPVGASLLAAGLKDGGTWVGVGGPIEDQGALQAWTDVARRANALLGNCSGALPSW